MSAAASSQLEHLADCPVCATAYKDPRVLPCGHTFCLRCMRMCFKEIPYGDKLPCPLCRKMSIEYRFELTDLPNNFLAADFVQMTLAGAVNAAVPTRTGALKLADCPGCGAAYSDPRVLPCGHTFCLGCIRICFKQNRLGYRLMRCPLCEKLSMLPLYGLSDLPKNFFVADFVQTILPGTGDALPSAGNALPTRTRALKLLTHNIDGCVEAMTSLDDEVYVVRSGSQQQIDVYSAKGFTLQRHIDVPRSGYNWGLAACPHHRCLYMSDSNRNSVLRAPLSGMGPTKTWAVPGCPVGLSVNGYHNVVVACCGANAIREFTTDGTPVREITGQSGATDPWHAVQLSTGDYVVVSKLPGVVSVLKPDGQVVSSYGRSQAEDEMKYPTGLAVTPNDLILVADTNNNRLLSIRGARGSVQEVCLPAVEGIQLKMPLCLCLDRSRDRLYVGGDGRVWVLDNARLVYDTDALKEA